MDTSPNFRPTALRKCTSRRRPHPELDLHGAVAGVDVGPVGCGGEDPRGGFPREPGRRPSSLDGIPPRRLRAPFPADVGFGANWLSAEATWSQIRPLTPPLTHGIHGSNNPRLHLSGGLPDGGGTRMSTRGGQREQVTVSSARLLAIGLVVAFFVAACGTAVDETDAGVEPAVEPEGKPDELIVRTWGDIYQEALLEGAAASFTAETGIPVVWDLTTHDVINTRALTAIRAGDRPPVDVVYNTGIAAAQAAAQELIVPLASDIVTHLDELNQTVAQPSDGSWDWVGFYSYSLPFLYRTDMVGEGELTSWEDLYDPKWANSIEVCDWVFCHLAPMARILGLELDEDDLTPLWEKLRTLRPNIALIGSDAEAVQALITGQAKISIHLVAVGLAAQAEGAPVAWVVPEEGVTVERDAMYVLRNLPPETEYYAQVFINHVLSQENQSLLADKLGVVPVHLSATLPDFMRGDPAFPFTEEDIQRYGVLAPTELLAENESEWQAEYERALKG